MEGLTSWELGQKMGMSEHDATLRLQRAMCKLGCASMYEAALRTIKSGFVKSA
jgi:DNA-binding NarL/FixJ family response regulator